MERRQIIKGAVDDLVLLDDISERGAVDNLRNRFNKDLIYTYIGPVLVSVNPFKEIRGLYSKQLMQRYYGKHKFEQAPHVYASAEEAYRGVMSTGKDQCILVSGESGAGKTEAAKKIMEYITQVSDDRAEADANISVRDIKDALLNSNPVLEAFGNATTLRNDNSSRFGKYMVIQMDYNGVPIGGHITNYLLEKPRVVNPGPGERGFHIFYQLCAGSAGREFGLSRPEDFRYISGLTKVRSIDDSADFQQMASAMGKVGINAEAKNNLFQLVAAILWIGNIDFEKVRGKQDKCSVSGSSSQAVSQAARLLDVSDKDLVRALTHRTIQSRIETVTSPLTSVDECAKTRDALSKALYSRCFQKLVEMINKAINTDHSELSLGVLDIYGFEIFEHNSFEQLCINFANEKLQQLFIELTLKAEQEEYAREGIKWKHIDFFNNKIVCDLIEAKRPAGVIAYLDEECIYPKGTDKTFLKKMDNNLSRHQHYRSLATKTNRTASEFLIKHYAGDVIYSVEGILDKNKDTLFRDLIELIGRGSRSQFLNDLFPEARERHHGKKPITAGTAFVRDMQGLINQLEQCEPHYIRTIKPNDNKRSGEYDVDRVVHQVRYLGLVENIKVRRAGFAFRQEYSYFVQRYKMLNDNTWPHANGRPESDCQTILRGLGIQDFESGKTKVFVREPTSVFTLEDSRDKKLHFIAKLIQSAYRAYKARLYFLRLREDSAHLLHGKKRRRNSWVLYFLGDYMFAQDNNMITSQIDGRVKFADEVVIYEPKKYMPVKHYLVITKSSLYLFDEEYKVFVSKSLQAFQSFYLSTYADGFMLFDHEVEVPKKQVYKPIPTIIMESMRKAEIVTVLHEEARSFPLKFQDEIPVLVQKKKMMFGVKLIPKTLRFQESSNPALQGRAECRILWKKPENMDFKETVVVDVSPQLASRAEFQLDSPLPAGLSGHKMKPGTKKKVPYGGYRRR